MKILIVGAGPAGLSFAALMGTADRSHDITILERGAANHAPGWGVTLRDYALSFLGLGQRVPYQKLEGRAFRYRGELMLDLPYPPGIALATLSRVALIQALTDCCRESGVRLCFNADAASLSDSDIAGYDLVVAADGANSALRRRDAEIFKPGLTLGQNRYAWVGAAVPFHKLTILLRDEGPSLLAWAYRYAADLSTFIVECTEKTWQSHFSGQTSAQTGATIATAFQSELSGQSILTGNSITWQRYQTISCERLQHRNIVLVGDAAHTTHFSQGFGTMFAFDDALSLHTALNESDDIPQALAAYEERQRPKMAAFQATASTSMRWGEILIACAAGGDEAGVRRQIAARWPNNEVTASPLPMGMAAETTLRTQPCD